MGLHPHKTGCFVAGFAIFATLLFWAVLPAGWQANESADYATFYAPVARNLLAGKGMVTTDGEFAARYPPGFPVVLAGVFKLGNWLGLTETAAISGLVIICTGVSAWLVFAIAAQVWGSLWALLPGAVWSTYPFYLWLTKQPNSEVAYIPFLFGAFFLIFRAACNQNGKPWWFFTGGLLCAAATLIRPAGVAVTAALWLCLLVVIPARAIKLRLMAALTFLAGWLILITPWQVTLNQNDPSGAFLSTGGALSLRDGFSYTDNENTGTYFPRPSRAVERVSEKLIAVTSNDTATSRIVTSIWQAFLREPGAVIQFYSIKAARSWYGNESGRLELPTLLLQIPYLLIAVVALIRCIKTGGAARALAICAGVVVLANWALTIAALSILRYMTPVMPFLFLLLPGFFAQKCLKTQSMLASYPFPNEIET